MSIRRRRAKVFRRTGLHTMAVQLMDEEGKMFLPGIVEIECSSSSGGGEKEEMKEGMLTIDVLLGAYDPWKRRFTRCEVCVDDADKTAARRPLKGGPASVGQRPFRWCSVTRSKKRKNNKREET